MLATGVKASMCLFRFAIVGKEQEGLARCNPPSRAY
jgi:hypothetical protein